MIRLVAVVVLLPLAALGHEAWLSLEDGGVVLRLGEDFTGDARPFARDRTAALRVFTDGGWRTVEPGDGGLATLPLSTAALVSYDSRPATITLEAAEFDAYLREEGLLDALGWRADAGESGRPGRERYQRCLKLLAKKGAFAVRTDQRLELIPASDPLVATPERPITFQLRSEGKPLGAAAVQAWSWRGDNLVRVMSRTGPDGNVTFWLPHSGRWMLATVRIQRLRGVPELEWESVWTTLAFTVEGRQR